MHARSTTIRGNPGAAHEGTAYLRDKALPVLQDMDGFVGLSMLVERETGRFIMTSAWEDEEKMRASAERVHPMRERLVALFGGEPEVQEWEIAVLHRAHETGDGGCGRVTWTEGDPRDLDRIVDGYKSSLMPKLQEMPGFCSCSLLVDRASGRTVGTVSFADRDALTATRESAARIREEFTRAMGRTVTDVAEMDLVLAHLRVPETV
ncbi:antibiotic biosynthesis monooxygenase [Geodermatophilus sp. SYSU D00691]